MEVSVQLHAPAALPPSGHCVGDWVDPRAGLDVMEKRKNPLPLPGIDPLVLGRVVCNLVSILAKLSPLQFYIEGLGGSRKRFDPRTSWTESLSFTACGSLLIIAITMRRNNSITYRTILWAPRIKNQYHKNILLRVIKYDSHNVILLRWAVSPIVAHSNAFPVRLEMNGTTWELWIITRHEVNKNHSQWRLVRLCIRMCAVHSVKFIQQPIPEAAPFKGTHILRPNASWILISVNIFHSEFCVVSM
jgi:hypothetical protein